MLIQIMKYCRINFLTMELLVSSLKDGESKEVWNGRNIEFAEKLRRYLSLSLHVQEASHIYSTSK